MLFHVRLYFRRVRGEASLESWCALEHHPVSFFAFDSDKIAYGTLKVNMA